MTRAQYIVVIVEAIKGKRAAPVYVPASKITISINGKALRQNENDDRGPR